MNFKNLQTETKKDQCKGVFYRASISTYFSNHGSIDEVYFVKCEEKNG